MSINEGGFYSRGWLGFSDNERIQNPDILELVDDDLGAKEGRA